MKELFQLNEGNVRASTYLYNTKNEIQRLLGAVEEMAKNE
jgi:selenocysteine lyase/cysteine desulfurase